jgi:hypothetical protein
MKVEGTRHPQSVSTSGIKGVIRNTGPTTSPTRAKKSSDDANRSHGTERSIGSYNIGKSHFGKVATAKRPQQEVSGGRIPQRRDEKKTQSDSKNVQFISPKSSCLQPIQMEFPYWYEYNLLRIQQHGTAGPHPLYYRINARGMSTIFDVVTSDRVANSILHGGTTHAFLLRQ